jgi:hypothetical protein
VAPLSVTSSNWSPGPAQDSRSAALVPEPSSSPLLGSRSRFVPGRQDRSGGGSRLENGFGWYRLERAMGFEPTTPTLARLPSAVSQGDDSSRKQAFQYVDCPWQLLAVAGVVATM